MNGVAVACRGLVLGIVRGMGGRRERRIGTFGFLPVVINAVLRGALQVYGPQGMAQSILFFTVPLQNLLAHRGILDGRGRQPPSEIDGGVLGGDLCAVGGLGRPAGRRSGEPPGRRGRRLVGVEAGRLRRRLPLQAAVVDDGLVYLFAARGLEDKESFA